MGKKQQLLFDPPRSPWVKQLWRQIPRKRRREIIAALAEMARITLTQAQPKHVQHEKREANDES